MLRVSDTNYAEPICEGFWAVTAASNYYRDSTECPVCHEQVETTIAPNGSIRIAIHNSVVNQNVKGVM